MNWRVYRDIIIWINGIGLELQEIEEKAPILQQQRKDYEQALRSVDQLSRRLDSALVVSAISDSGLYKLLKLWVFDSFFASLWRFMILTSCKFIGNA